MKNINNFINEKLSKKLSKKYDVSIAEYTEAIQKTLGSKIKPIDETISIAFIDNGETNYYVIYDNNTRKVMSEGKTYSDIYNLKRAAGPFFDHAKYENYKRLQGEAYWENVDFDI